ncbi:SDR family oxidoreductase [Millisia brevis]|uniref:SDR family oxidoreductase n=1 Tax=Millisia brevis TaxID=264148 RepID=UPI00082AA6C7|nr:SDR family NAD(P)-dependent oxidoreductase [Millisia brevis]
MSSPSTVDLTGKVAVITGSGRGLGLAYARALAAAGASVVVNDVDEQVAADAAASIRAAGGNASHLAVAVGTSDAADALVSHAVTEHGSLDIVVSNAGILRDKVLWKLTDEDFDAVINVHLRGSFTLGRAAAIHFKQQGTGGRIILIGSPAGQFGNFGQSNYSAAKAALVAMTKVWALELARDKITTNAIVPVAATAMTATVPFLKPYVDALEAGEPLPPYARRDLAFGPPEDVAGLAVFLASDEAAEVTGQAIGIGGDKLSLYRQADPVVTEFHDGGWSADDIAAAWPKSFAEHLQPAGEQLPPPPA